MSTMSPVAYFRPMRTAAPLPKLTGLSWILMRGSPAQVLASMTCRVRSLDPSLAMMISFSMSPMSTARTRSTSSPMVCSSLYTGMMIESFIAGCP